MYEQYGDSYKDYYFAKDLYVEYGGTEQNFTIYNRSTSQDRFEPGIIRKYGYEDDFFGMYQPGVFDSDPPTLYIKSHISNIVIPRNTYIEFYFSSTEKTLHPISYTVDSVSPDIELSIGGQQYIWSHDIPSEGYKATDNPVIKTKREINGIDLLFGLVFKFDEDIYNPKDFTIYFGE